MESFTVSLSRILLPLTRLNTAITPLTIGNVVSANISEKGEQDTYIFTGTAGQQLFYNALGGDYFRLHFYDPTGRELFNVESRDNRGSDGSLTLTMNGTYKILIDHQSDLTGSYSFRLLDKADATIINLDTDITGTFDESAAGSVGYRFSLTERTYLYFDGQSATNAWGLYNTNGQYITSSNLNSDSEFWLGQGDYYLVVQGYSNVNYSTYSLRLITPDVSTLIPLTIGNVVSGNISEKGEQDTYTFTGTAGQQLFFDSLGSDFFYAYLYDPTGRLLWQQDSRSDRGTNNGLVFAVDGTYKLVIDGGRDQDGYGVTGNYKFRLLDKAMATPIAFDQDITGTFADSGLDSQTYRFTVTMDQYFYFDAQTGDSANQWILYGNGGQLITSTNLSNDQEFRLGKGEYWLVAQGNGGTNLNYQFRLVTPDLITNGLTLGSPVIGNIAEVGEQDTYTFTGSVGQQLFFDALVGNSNIKARLYAPSGVLILDNDTNADWGAFNLAEAGTYRLVIDAIAVIA